MTASHDHTLAATPGILIPPIDVHLFSWPVVTRVESRVAGHVLVVLPDLADDVVKGVVDVDAALRGRLDKVAAEGSCELSPFCSWIYLSARCDTCRLPAM